MNTLSKTALLRASVAPILIGAMLPVAAFAQAVADCPPGQNCEEPGEAIVVTGSRIAQPNAVSASPVTVIGAETIRESGYSKIEDLANTLPQVFAGQSSGVSNGADGTATIDLRGLGPSRTVVLVDGRRLMPGNIGGGAGADLNFIPSTLVSSVELLTGGASATYGADAVAGVVNFKMNRSFRGVRLDAQYGFYSHENDDDYLQGLISKTQRAPSGTTNQGGAYDATMVLGAGFDDDRGSIVAYAGYRHDSAITQANYDYSACTLNADFGTGGFACGGSGTPARTRIGGITAANATLAGLPTASSYTLTDSGALVPYVGARDAYNFGPVNYFRRPSNRYSGGVFAEYEIDEHFKPYMDFMFMDYSTKAQIAPAGAFYGVQAVNCNNPLLTTQIGTAICGTDFGTPTQASILLGKRNIEGGPRFNDIGFNQFRIVTGMRGDINEAFSYDAYAQFGQIKAANVYRNDTSSAKIAKALLVDPNGQCQSFNDGTDLSCIPYNVFAPGGVTPAAAAYIGIPLVLTGTTKETVVNASITGDLGKYGFISPFAVDSIKTNIGVEYRKEELATQPDQSYINGDGAGQGGPTLPIAGQYTVKDIFGELSLPLIQDKPFFQALAVNLGFRHSSYNVSGAAQQNKADTYKIEGTWSPIDDIKFRGSYNRAVRSPNITELFFNQQVGLFGGSDPCAGEAVGGLVNGNTAAQCALAGVSAAQFGNVTANEAEQYNQFSGGSLDLRPEKADTFTAGVVLSPQSFVRGLVLSVDYFNIKVKDAVGTIGAQVILDQCVGTGDPFFCSKINRTPSGVAAGSLYLDESGFVNNQTVNTGSLKTTGWDINGDYRTSIGNNTLRWQFVGVVLDSYVNQPLTGGFKYDCAGLYGPTCGNPSPKFRFSTNVKWTFANDIALTVRWRYLSKVKVDSLSSDPDLASPGSAPTIDEVLKQQSYFDLQATLPIKDTISLRMGINNVLDKQPPQVSQSSVGGFANGNTFPGTYDTLGRQLFVNLTADF